MANTKPDIKDYATIEGYVGKDDVPVYAFGYTYVYGLGPDLLPGVVMQAGNPHPVNKFKPKKSWEIQDNVCGSTPAREPKTMWNDDQPLLPIHLIDGDPETAWASRMNSHPERNPEWIRIDLPAESIVASVAMIVSKVGPCIKSINGVVKAGKLLPRELTIKLSRDARQWETVYENKNFSGPDAGATLIEFQPRPAKQIWIIANKLQTMGWGYSFSIGELEVRDPAGNNLALLTRGAGVQVSSTYYGFGMDRYTQEMLWPIQYDLGFKWLRVGYDMGMYLWSYVEREKGILRIDEKADLAITEACRNGMKVIMCLDKGNWLYHDPPRKVDWRKARVREMMDTYWDHQGWPSDSPELMEGYLRYVDYMVRHFKGRVAYYEICNEAQGIGVKNYAKVARATISVIKNADPDARVMLGSTGGFDYGFILACLGKEMRSEIRNGEFVCEGPWRTTAVLEKVNKRDLEVSVEARADAEAGIILQYVNNNNCVLATYAPQYGCIYIRETSPFWTFPLPRIESVVEKRTTGLTGKIRLVARSENNIIAFTVSDGNKSFNVTAPVSGKVVNPDNSGGFGGFMPGSSGFDVRNLEANAGRVGLSHGATDGQIFDNFRVTDLQGQLLYENSFDGPDGQFPSGWKNSNPFPKPVEKGLGPQLDAIGFHPWYGVNPDTPAYRHYRKDIELFRKATATLGFKGRLAATEWSWWAPYPHSYASFEGVSEMQKAKYSAQLMTTHAGMDIVSLYCETFQNSHDIDASLLRNGFQNDPISPAQPQPIYYVLRSISTVLDGFRGTAFPVTFSGERHFEHCTFMHGNKELMVAVWIPGKTKDGIVEMQSDITLPGVQARRIWVMDVFNGTGQELIATRSGDGTMLKGMLIKDYPVFMRIVQ